MSSHIGVPKGFSSYEKFVIAMLVFMQFTVILDFMIMSPLGASIMPSLQITPAQFGIAVSVYAFSAGIAGLLAAGIADRFDRKRMLLVFYVGFLIGTLLCAVAETYEFLLFARMVAGLFGGVLGAIGFAIIVDLFAVERRGRVMGMMQTAFAASQILGLPAGLYLCNHWGWHAPFYTIVALGLLAGVLIVARMKPITTHLTATTQSNPFQHFARTVGDRRNLLAFVTTALLSIGGYMLMPFGSAFTVNNLGIAFADLPLIYLVTGVATIFISPLVGKISDAWGSMKVFVFGSLLSIVMVCIYTNLGRTSLLLVMIVNVLMFVSIFSRMIPSQTLISVIPEASSRGAFMSVNSSLQQIAGGFASVAAGAIVVQGSNGELVHFDRLGYTMMGIALVSLVLMFQVNRVVQKKLGKIHATQTQ